MLEKGHVWRFGPLLWRPNPKHLQFFEGPDLPGEISRSIEWHFPYPHKSPLSVTPWIILTKIPMGCKYGNTHSPAMSNVLNCNTHVQVGDGSNAFSATCYLSKSTQEEDCEPKGCISSTII